MTYSEKLEMITLWIDELMRIRTLCISQGYIDKVSQLKLKRINKEIKEVLGDISNGTN